MNFLIFCLFACLINLNFQKINSEIPTNYNRNTSMHAPSTIGNDEYLQRIHNQMYVLANEGERQNQKLENIKNRFERFEAINREQLDSIHNEIKDLERRMQTFEWVATRSENTANQLKNELENLLQNLTSNVGKRNAGTNHDIDYSEKLDALAIFLSSTRSAIHKIEKQNNILVTNITSLLHTIMNIAQRQHVLPTKQYLHSALNSLRPQPLYGLNQNSFDRLNPNIPSLPKSCAHIAISSASSGIHKIQTSSTKDGFYVMCNYDIEGGGWTVIQNRQDGRINFNRNWLEYKSGFGNIAGEFFIGLDKLHEMTTVMLHELLIVLEDFEGIRKFARYKQFAIGDEKEDYALRVLGEYEGDAGDSLSYSASYKFSTFDNDNDGWIEGNCASAHTGAWWYNACEMSNLNGQYFNGDVPESNQFQGIYWNEFKGSLYSLKSVKMMIRPVDRPFINDLN